MKLRVLGCSGGELGPHRPTCFLLDGSIALDAGALAAGLSLDELAAVDHVVLTHGHLDHVKDVALAADLLVGRRERPVQVHASRGCIETLRAHLLGGALWPDFTRLPDPSRPVLQLRPFDAGATFRVGGFTFRSVPVHHTVESTGYLVSDGASAFALSGDTGPTEELWHVVNACPELRAVLVETSFPDRLQALAEVSGHHTPWSLEVELRKIARRELAFFVYHLKPAFHDELLRELARLRPLGVRALEQGETLEV